MMKVCLLSDAWMPVWGGGQTHLLETSKLLGQKADIIIDILVPNLTSQKNESYPLVEELVRGRVIVRRLGPKFVFPKLIGRLLFSFVTLLWMIRNNYDIYHSHCYLSAILPLVKLLKPKAKFVYTVHGAGVNFLGGGVLNTLGLPQKFWEFFVYQYRWDILFTAAAATITRSPSARMLVVAGNGVDVKRFDRVKAAKNNRRFKILWVGRGADPVKGLRYLKEAVAKVQWSNPKVVLETVEGVYGEELVRKFQSSQLFVLPSLSEGLPMVLLEAMAARLPVVTTDVGDCKQLVTQSGCGVVVPPGNTNSLTTAIREMCVRRDLQKMGLLGYNYVKRHYSWTNVAEKIYARYQTILSE